MTARKITFPELAGVASVGDKTVKWGLHEYFTQIIIPNALGSAELCEMSIRLLKAISGLEGENQVGKSIVVSTEDWKLLRSSLAHPPAGAPPEMLMAFAVCNKAILLAAEVEDAKPEAPAVPAGPAPKARRGRRL